MKPWREEWERMAYFSFRYHPHFDIIPYHWFIKAGGGFPRTVKDKTRFPRTSFRVLDFIQAYIWTWSSFTPRLVPSPHDPMSHTFLKKLLPAHPPQIHTGFPSAFMSRLILMIMRQSSPLLQFSLSIVLPIMTLCAHPCTSMISSTHADAFELCSSLGYCYSFLCFPFCLLVYVHYPHPTPSTPFGSFHTCCLLSFLVPSRAEIDPCIK